MRHYPTPIPGAGIPSRSRAEGPGVYQHTCDGQGATDTVRGITLRTVEYHTEVFHAGIDDPDNPGPYQQEKRRRRSKWSLAGNGRDSGYIGLTTRRGGLNVHENTTLQVCTVQYRSIGNLTRDEGNTGHQSI